MGWFILLLLIVVALAFGAAWLNGKSSTNVPLPYRQHACLFSPAERSFLGVLDQALAGRYRVFGKVRVADVVAVSSTSDRSARQRAFNRISAKHFDFVLCSPDDLQVVAAIELDDRSHRRSARQKRDRFLADLCAAISLPLVRVAARNSYSIEEIRTQLHAEIAPADESASNSESGPSSSQTSPSIFREAGDVGPESAPTMDTPACPECGAETMSRRAESGTHAGRIVWTCVRFPQCLGLVGAKTTASENPASMDRSS